MKNQQAVLDMVAKTACQSCAALVPDIFNRLIDSRLQASELQAQSGNTSASRQILSIYSLVYENKLDLQQKLNQRFEANLTQALDNFLQKREQMKSGLMTDSAEWTLMEADEVDKLIIIKNLTHKLIVNHEASLFEVGSRLATLAVGAGVPVSINPLRPDILVDAIYEMWESSHASRDPGLSLLFSKSLTEEVVGDLRPMYLSVVEVFKNLNIQPTKPTLLDRQSSGSPYSSTSGGATGFQQSGSQNPLTGATLGGNAGQTNDSSAAPLPISVFNRLQKLAGGLLPPDSNASSDLLSAAGLDPSNISALGSGAADASGSNNALTLQLLSQLVSRLPPPAAPASAPVALRPMANEAMSALVPLNAKSDVLNALGYLQSAQLQQPEQFRQALSPDPAQLTQTEGDVTDYLDPLSPVDAAQAGPVKFVNVVRSIQQSEIGQKTSTLNATVIELVARVFDFVFQDKYISDTVKLLLSRLQIPLLKAALLDLSFFEQSDHPARKLVNTLASAAMGWQEADGQQAPLFVLIEKTVNRAVSEFKEDLSLFETLSEEVKAFVKQQEEEVQRQTELERQQAQQAATENENQELANRVARQAIEERLSDKTTVPFVSNFLRDAWVKYLCRLLINSQNDTTQLSNAMITADDLLWSIEPKSDTLERARMLVKVPVIESQIRSGIAQIEWPGEHVKAFFAALDDRWAGAVIGEPIMVTETGVDNFHAGAVTQPAPVENPIDEDEQQEDAAMQLVTELEPGTVVELTKDDGAVFVYKVGWVSEAKTRILLTNRLNSAPLIVTAKYLAERYRSGKMQMMDRQPLMDRALNNMLDALEETRYPEEMMHQTGAY
ncbi:MAG: DUF1631 family protein [Burkholderiales bacterium]